MTDTNGVYLTKEGLEELKKEIHGLHNQKRPQIVKRVAEARAMGDLSENAEYSNAREELALTDGRIEELEKIISQAKLIRGKKKKGNNKAVALGCKVTVKANGKSHVYSIVGEWEADPLKKKISHNSPLGRALLGKRKGEKTAIKAPAGKIIYEIISID